MQATLRDWFVRYRCSFMKVPFVDLGAQYQAHKEEFDAALARVIEKTAFIGGAAVREFESSFAERLGVSHCVACGNGTDAIYIALRMLGVGPGDEVITTASTWIATSETVSQTGARPVFVDVDEYFLLDVEAVEKAISPRTRAIIPVHLYGQPAEMDALVKLCNEHKLFLIEDCAQAHFARWNDQHVGTFGDIATFSFYPGKNLGAWGDAGAVVTRDEELALKCRMFANHGALIKHEHQIEGINSRMDGLQASLLAAKLQHIGDWTAQRRGAAAAYSELLAGVGDVQTPKVREQAKHVFHLYVIKTEYRDELREFLAGQGVQTGIHYPTPVPLLEAYSSIVPDTSLFPNASRDSSQILSLPMFPELSQAQIEYVSDQIKAFFASVNLRS